MKTIHKDKIVLDGRYLIADPAYVIDKLDWHLFNTLMMEREEHPSQDRRGIITFKINGQEVYICHSRFGQGCFPILHNGEDSGILGVESGLFAFFPWGETLDRDDRGPILELKGELSYSNGNSYVDDEVIVDTNGETD